MGGLPEMVKHRETGLLIPLRDETALYLQILTLYQDWELGRRLGENGYQFLAKFDINATRQRYLQLYA